MFIEGCFHILDFSCCFKFCIGIQEIFLLSASKTFCMFIGFLFRSSFNNTNFFIIENVFFRICMYMIYLIPQYNDFITFRWIEYMDFALKISDFALLIFFDTQEGSIYFKSTISFQRESNIKLFD